MRVGILHPGAMGADLGHVLSARHDVMWFGRDRSPDTRERANASGFIEAPTLADLVHQADVIISICPPHAARSVAQEIALIRSHGLLYVEANTVAPATMREIAGRFASNVVVDATLTGAPGSDDMKIWISGERKSEVSDLFAGTRIDCRVVGDIVGQASAFKICAGLRSKVMPAIWATLIEAASVAGEEVEGAVRTHLSDIGYDLDREAARVAERAPKAWRWIGEMDESAEAMRELGLPAGFSEAAAATYGRIASQLGATNDGGAEMNCKHCGKPAIGILFTKGVAEDVPACKKCSNTPRYKGWQSQSLNTAASATGRMIRDRFKAVSC